MDPEVCNLSRWVHVFIIGALLTPLFFVFLIGHP